MAFFDNWTGDAKYDAFKKLKTDLGYEIAARDLMDNPAPKFEIIPLEDSMEDAKKRLAHPGQIQGLSTGYSKLDSIVGGFENEELVVVSGGTGQGKSLWIQGIMLNMALEGIPVLYFTLEMPPVDTTIRFMKMIKSKDAGDILPDLPIYYYHGDNANLEILEEAIKQGVERGVKCVFIDHLHFFAKTNQNQAAEIGNIAREIKLMARRYHIPIVLVAHVRKVSGGGIPGLEDLKDSSGIAQDADTVLMVWRKIDATEETEKRRLSVRVRKNRRMGIISGTNYLMDENTYLQEVDYAEAFDDF